QEALVQLRQLDSPVRQRKTELRHQVTIDHGNIEGQTPAHQRPAADKGQQLVQRVMHLVTPAQIHRPHAVDADRLRRQAFRRLQLDMQGAGTQYTIADDFYRSNRHQFRRGRIKAGGFTVNGDTGTAVGTLEQTGVLAIALSPIIQPASYPPEPLWPLHRSVLQVEVSRNALLEIVDQLQRFAQQVPL